MPTKTFSSLGAAALYLHENNMPASWCQEKGGKYVCGDPPKKKAGKKKAKKRTTKRRARTTTKKRTTKKRTTKKRTTKRRATKKRTTKKRATKKPSKWGASTTGTTPRAKFFRSQKSRGRSPGQAKAAWNLSRAAKKKRAKKR